jgi:hypothetical protein
MARKKQERLTIIELRRRDTTIQKIRDALVILLVEKSFASKREILKFAGSLGMEDTLKWLQVLNVIRDDDRKQKRNSLILPLRRFIFLNPKAAGRHGLTPNQFISPTIKHAYGFADVPRFVLLGDLHREIVESKYHRTQIAAAKALEIVKQFEVAISAPVTRLGAP